MYIGLADMALRGHITTIGYMITIYSAISVLLATNTLHISSSNTQSNNITLVCQYESSTGYIQNAEFWRDSIHRVTDITYNDHTTSNTSALISLTPQEEGSYTCRDPVGNVSSSNHIVLLAYPSERPDTRYSYTAEVGQSVVLSCPFLKGALGHFYSHSWYRGFTLLITGDPRYQFNNDTFQLTVVNAGFEDDTTGEIGYVCRVMVNPPSGNQRVKNSRPISLVVTNGTVGTTTTTIDSSFMLLPSSTVVLNNTRSGNETLPAAITAVIVIVTLVVVGLTTTVIVTVVILVKRRRRFPGKSGSDITPRVQPVYDGDHSHASTCQVSDAEEGPARTFHNTFILDTYFSSMAELNGHPPTVNNHHTTEPLRVEASLAASLEQRTHNTAVSHCSSLFKKQLEPRGDYSATSDIEFVGSIQVVDCDRQGGEYHNKEHSVKVRIQRDPFHRDDNERESMELEIGVAIHGHVSFPEDWRPVSPVVWLNVAENFEYEFGKNIEVELPHYLKLSGAEIITLSTSQQLGWMYVCSDPEISQLTAMEFVRGDPASCCFMQCNGKIVTRRGCYMCLCARRCVIETHATFCLVSAVQRPLTQTSEFTIFFFVCYHLNSFIELIKMELKSRESFIESNVFMFTPDTAEGEGEPKIAINCGHKSTSKGWQLTLPPDTTEVCLRAIELWENDVSDLRLRLQHKRYPPRVKLVATPTPKAHNTHEVFAVTGARHVDQRKKFSLQIPLTAR